MADDIDIEEHDLLDNPMIKNIFPDISALKKEIYEEESEIKQELVSSGTLTLDSVAKSTSLSLKPDTDTDCLEFNSKLHNLNEQHSLSLNGLDNDPGKKDAPSDKATEYTTSVNALFTRNKIILGTKPSKESECEKFFEKHIKIDPVKVVLDDLGPYLVMSKRYCKECLILFPKSCDLSVHKSTVHLNYNQLISKQKRNIKQKCKSQATPQHKKRKCNLCGGSFSSSSNLSRHHKNIHAVNDKTNKINKIMLEVQNKLHDPETVDLDKQNACFHCNKAFPTQQSLIEHIYKVLQSKKSNKKCRPKKLKEQFNHKKNETKEENYNIDLDIDKNSDKVPQNAPSNSSDDLYYRCNICSYYFRDLKVCMAHRVSKHKETKKLKVKKVSFDPQCKHCSSEFKHMDSYNCHLHKFHRQQVFSSSTTIKKAFGKKYQSVKVKTKIKSFNHLNCERDEFKYNSLIFKAIIFKCNKCDIHFLSAKLATKHTDHMEMLINWKCSTCLRIFKKEDELSHNRQHSISHEFTVYDLNASSFSRVLFACPKCTIHYTEDNFLSHYTRCGIETPKSVYCKVCDILVDNCTGKSHELSHQCENFKADDFIFIESEIIPNENLNGKCTIKDTIGLKQTSDECSFETNTTEANEPDLDDIRPDVVTSDDEGPLKQTRKNKRKSDEHPCGTQSKKKKHNLDYMFIMTYCKTCNCFLANSVKRKVHLEARCGHLVKYVCTKCGLILTAKAYQTHKTFHSKIKNLKLQDFSFVDIESGKKICPPVPEYPKCNICDVYLVSKGTLSKHECSKDNYLMCHICKIKLSEEAFKLHMMFHNYSRANIRKKIGTSSKLLKHSPEPNSPEKVNRRESTKISTSDNHENDAAFSSKFTKHNLIGSDFKDTTYIVNSKLKLDMLDNRINLSSSKPNLPDSLNLKQAADTFNHEFKVSEIKNNFKEILYCCSNCHLTVDSYDKAVEHCQRHFSQEEIDITKESCSTCELTFDSVCYEKHKGLHLDNKNFRVFKFDTFYFTSEHGVWINHVFGSLPQQRVDEIVNQSIYKSECRLKMEVIQDGRPELTVYKCDKCRCFIDSRSLYRHAENACFKLRRHPCSFCGLPFISSETRMQHEKIHKIPNIGLKSFRIVTFNRDKDKSFNDAVYSRKHYVLYQCRNCDGVLDKPEIANHECNRNGLKKCFSCGLLIYKERYEMHDLRHQDLISFTQSNMKVILFGEKTKKVKSNSADLVSSFNGIIYDYTFYSCIECQICEKTVQCTFKHACSFGALRSKCPDCELYFFENKLNHHRKIHRSDSEFIRENIRIITFKPVKFAPLPAVKTAKYLKEPENQTKNTDTTGNPIDGMVQVSQPSLKTVGKSVKIYKCRCGLHFLDEQSISTHSKLCSSKIRASKQKCSKCDLLFTPNILFSHLLKHHGDKNYVYTFDIVEITKSKEVVYKCSKCNLHFVNDKKVSEHFKACEGITSEGTKCPDCSLHFDQTSFISHAIQQHNDSQKEYEVIIINESTSLVLRGDLTENMIHPQVDEDSKTESDVLNDRSIQNFNNYDRIIYKCKECGIHYMTKKSINTHLNEKHDFFTKLQDICNICGLNFTSSSLAKHNQIHHEELNLKPSDFIILECVKEI